MYGMDIRAYSREYTLRQLKRRSHGASTRATIDSSQICAPCCADEEGKRGKAAAYKYYFKLNFLRVIRAKNSITRIKKLCLTIRRNKSEIFINFISVRCVALCSFGIAENKFNYAGINIHTHIMGVC
ncbi:hypothetical protein DMN91_002983 [Ooceraea biroi]|uniref:Uncharacterized protein n=1 Tax=Ooceraea biroi TaxID=2015173 RepID=A0A3L8DX73_OOCBI|nr:hypothetical protein DMN91_002983 [Ooceraea biroi]